MKWLIEFFLTFYLVVLGLWLDLYITVILYSRGMTNDVICIGDGVWIFYILYMCIVICIDCSNSTVSCLVVSVLGQISMFVLQLGSFAQFSAHPLPSSHFSLWMFEPPIILLKKYRIPLSDYRNRGKKKGHSPSFILFSFSSSLLSPKIYSDLHHCFFVLFCCFHSFIFFDLWYLLFLLGAGLAQPSLWVSDQRLLFIPVSYFALASFILISSLGWMIM